MSQWSRSALALLVLAIPVVGGAKLLTSGEFRADMNILPTVGLKSAALTISLSYGAWFFSSTSEFGPLGFTNQQFSMSGGIGPFALHGGMAFNPTSDASVDVNFPDYCDTQSASVPLEPPAYKWSWLELKFTFIGFELAGRMEHWAYPYIPSWATPYFAAYMWPCCEPDQTPSAYMFFLFSVKASPAFLNMRFADCCYGISFSDLTLGFDDLNLCCGITLDWMFYFTKQGFQHVIFEIQNVPFICCGFALDFAVKFTVQGKEVSLRPKWVGVGNLCVQVYGDIHLDGASIKSIEIYGYKLRCELAPCHFVEFLTVLSPAVVDKVEKIIGDVFRDDEMEYMRFGFCGQGCCGADYRVDATIFFQQSGNSLFGFSRVAVNMEVPLLANFAFTSSFTLPSQGNPEMSMGFVFRF